VGSVVGFILRGSGVIIMGKNYTPSVSLVKGVPSFDQTTPEKRKKFVVGKIVGAELNRLREKGIEHITRNFESNLDKINNDRRKRGVSLIEDITELKSDEAIDVLGRVKISPDNDEKKAEKKDWDNYLNVLFPITDSRLAEDLSIKEFESFDLAWNNYLKSLPKKAKATSEEKTKQGDIYQRMDESDSSSLSGSFFESGTKKKE